MLATLEWARCTCLACMRTRSRRATKRRLSFHAGPRPIDAFSEYLFHSTKPHAVDVVESVYYTCSSGRDRSSIQACSKSGDILSGGVASGGPVERAAGGRPRCSGDIMGAETAAVSRQTEAVCQANTGTGQFSYN